MCEKMHFFHYTLPPIHTHTRMHEHTHTSLHTHIYTQTHDTHTQTHMYAHTQHTHIYTYMRHTRMRTHTHTYTHTHVRAHTHTHTHTHTAHTHTNTHTHTAHTHTHTHTHTHSHSHTHTHTPIFLARCNLGSGSLLAASSPLILMAGSVELRAGSAWLPRAGSVRLSGATGFWQTQWQSLAHHCVNIPTKLHQLRMKPIIMNPPTNPSTSGPGRGGGWGERTSPSRILQFSFIVTCLGTGRLLSQWWGSHPQPRQAKGGR